LYSAVTQETRENDHLRKVTAYFRSVILKILSVPVCIVLPEDI
jgi:hypothetical protein